MTETNPRIEDEILRVLLLLISNRRLKGEVRINEGALLEELEHKVHPPVEGESEEGAQTGEKVEQELVPGDLLQLVLKPDLPPEVLEMIAKLLNNDPEARRALVKLLTASSTPANIRSALTAVLAKCVEHGYSNAENVLRESLTKVRELTLLKQLTETIQKTSQYTADYLKLTRAPLHTHALRLRPKGWPEN